MTRRGAAVAWTLAGLLAWSPTVWGQEYGDSEDVGTASDEAEGEADHTWTWVLAGLTVASAAAGGALLGVAHSRQDQLVADLANTDTSGAVQGVSQVDAERIDKENHDLQTGAFVAFGVAASAAIGTLVVALTRSPERTGDDDDYDDEPYEVRGPDHFHVSPIAGGGYVGATWTF